MPPEASRSPGVDLCAGEGPNGDLAHRDKRARLDAGAKPLPTFPAACSVAIKPDPDAPLGTHARGAAAPVARPKRLFGLCPPPASQAGRSDGQCGTLQPAGGPWLPGPRHPGPQPHSSAAGSGAPPAGAVGRSCSAAAADAGGLQGSCGGQGRSPATGPIEAAELRGTQGEAESPSAQLRTGGRRSARRANSAGGTSNAGGGGAIDGDAEQSVGDASPPARRTTSRGKTPQPQSCPPARGLPQAQARGRASSAAALPSATLAAEDCTFVAARGSVSLKPRAVKALFPDQFAVLSSNTAAAPSPGRCGSAAGPGSTPFPGPASAPSPALGPGTGTDSTPGPSMGPGSQAGSKVTVTLHVQASDSGGLVPQDASLEVVANSTLHPLQPPWILSWRRLNGPLSALAAQPGTHLALSRNAEGRVVVDVFRARAKAATPGARATPAPSASAGLGRRLGVPTPGRPTASAGTGVTGRESAGKQNPGGGVGHSSDSSSGSEDEGGGGGDEGGAGPSRSAASPASAQRRRTSGPSAPGPGPDAPAAGEGRSGLPRDASDALAGSDGGALVTIALRNCLAMLEPHQLGMLLPETTAAEALSAQRAGGKYHHSVPLRLCAASAGGPHKATLVLQFGKLRLYFKAPTMQALNQPTVLRLRREGSALAVEALATAGAATVPALSPGAAAGGYAASGAAERRATPGAGGQDATAATAERSPASGEAVASAAWRITESVFSAFQVYVPAASVSGLLRPFFESGAQQFTVEAQVTDEPGSEPKRLSFSISRKGTGPCRATGLTSWLKRRGAIVGDRLLVTRLPGGGLGLSLTKHDGTPRLRPLGASFDGQGGGTTSGGEGAEKDAHGQDDVEEESGGESSSNEEGPAGGEAPPPGASRREATGPAASTGAGMTGREGVGKESSTRSGHTGDSSDSGESESEGGGSGDEGAAAGPSRSAASPASAQRRRTPGLAAPGPGPDAPTAGAAPSGMAVPPVCALAEGDTGVPVVEVALSKRLVILNLHQLHMLLSETTAAEALSAQRAGAKYHQSVPLRLCAAGARGAGPGEAFVSATQQPHTATLAVHCGALRLYFRTPTLQALGQPTALRLRREGSALVVEALATAGAATVPALSPGAAARGCMARGASACRATPGAGGQDATAATAPRSPAGGEAVASAAWRIAESVFRSGVVYVPAASVSGLLRPFFDSGAHEFAVAAQVTDEPGSGPKYLRVKVRRQGDGTHRASGLKAWLRERGAIAGDLLVVTRLPDGGLGLSLTKHDGSPRLPPTAGGGGGARAEEDAHGQDYIEEETGGESSSDEEGAAGGDAPPPGASRQEDTGLAASAGDGLTGRKGVGRMPSARSGHTVDSSDSSSSSSEDESGGSDDEGAAAAPSRSAGSPASAQRRQTSGPHAAGPGPDPAAGAGPSGLPDGPVGALVQDDAGAPFVIATLRNSMAMLEPHQLCMLLPEAPAAEALSAQRAGGKYHHSVPLRLCAASAGGAGPDGAPADASQQPHKATLVLQQGRLRLYFKAPTMQALNQPTVLRLRREGSALAVEVLATAGAAAKPAAAPGAAPGGCTAPGAAAGGGTARGAAAKRTEAAQDATTERSPASEQAVASGAWRITESVFSSGQVYVPAASVWGLLRAFFDSGAQQVIVEAQVTDEPGNQLRGLSLSIRRQSTGDYRATGLRSWLKLRGAIAGDRLVVTRLPGGGLGVSLTEHDGRPRLPPGRDGSEGQDGRMNSGGVGADEPNESSSDSGAESSSDAERAVGGGAASPSAHRPALPSGRTAAAALAVGATTPHQAALPGGQDLRAPASAPAGKVPAAAGSGPSPAAPRSAGPGAPAGRPAAPAPVARPGPGPSAAVEVGLAGSLAVLRPNEAQALGLRGAMGCYVQGALPLHIWPAGSGPNAGPGGCTAAVPLVRTVALVQQHGNLRLYLKQRVLDALGEALMIRLWREGDGLAVSSAPVPPTATAPHHVGPPHPHQPGKDTGGARADAPPVARGGKAARHDTPSLTPATATASWRLCMAALRYPRLDLPAAVVRGPLHGFLSTEESVRLDVAVEDEPGRTLKLRVKKVSKYHAYRAGGLQAFFVERDARVGNQVTLTRRPDGGLTLRLTSGEGGSAGASGSAGEAEEHMPRGKRYKSLTDLHAAAPEEGRKRAWRRSLGDVGQQRGGDQAEAEPQEQARSPQQQPQQEGAAAEGQAAAGGDKPAGVKRETGPILPASFLSAAHLQGCALSRDAVPPPALQPGELRLCGLTFHPELAPGVRSAMEAWEAGLAEQLAAEGLDGGLADALPEKLQIRILDPAARDLLKAAGIRTYMVTCHLSCLLGLSAYFDAPLPEHAPQLGPSFLAPGPDEGRGGAGLFAAAALRKGAVLGVLGGYVMPKAAARRHLIRGFQALSDEAKAELSARAARGAGRGPEEGQAASGGDVPSRYAWQLLEGSFHLPMPGSPDGWELSMLGYGSLAALINDPRQEPTGRVEGSDVGEEGGAAAAGANCAVVPVSVRGLTLPVVVALRDIQPGEQLLRDYGADWWAAFNKGSWNFASLSWQLRTEAVLHAEGALAALRKPAVEGEAAEGAGTH